VKKILIGAVCVCLAVGSGCHVSPNDRGLLVLAPWLIPAVLVTEAGIAVAEPFEQAYRREREIKRIIASCPPGFEAQCREYCDPFDPYELDAHAEHYEVLLALLAERGVPWESGAGESRETLLRVARWYAIIRKGEHLKELEMRKPGYSWLKEKEMPWPGEVVKAEIRETAELERDVAPLLDPGAGPGRNLAGASMLQARLHAFKNHAYSLEGMSTSNAAKPATDEADEAEKAVAAGVLEKIVPAYERACGLPDSLSAPVCFSRDLRDLYKQLALTRTDEASRDFWLKKSKDQVDAYRERKLPECPPLEPHPIGRGDPHHNRPQG
jgi:hypothetical protein